MGKCARAPSCLKNKIHVYSMRPKGARMKNQAYLVSASGVVSTPALFHAAYLHVVYFVSGFVEMINSRETRPVLIWHYVINTYNFDLKCARLRAIHTSY